MKAWRSLRTREGWVVAPVNKKKKKKKKKKKIYN
jgi:hypothetical protein